MILVGHPELRRRLAMSALEALSQRIVVRAHVRGIDRGGKITGRAPFSVPAFALAMAEQPLPAPTPIDDSVPPTVREFVTSALAAEPSRRPRVKALLAALP